LPALTRTGKPQSVPEVAVKKPAPVLKKGVRFYQEVVLSRWTACRTLGVDFRSQSQCGFLSSFEVEEATESGPRVVRQTVEEVRLHRAEAALQARLNAVLQKTRGAAFRITLGAGGEVVKFEGAQTPLALARAGELPGELTFLLLSSLDLDAWKELAQITFFRPRRPTDRDKVGRWSRPMTHSWGPLGAWVGQVTYASAGSAGKAAGLERYDYLLDLGYAPPRGAGAMGGALPFQVARADFRLQPGSGGSIAFDSTRGQVAAAEERFRVRGALAASALGVTSVVEMEETQHFQLRILDRKPTRP
jgi:hypothetical protein